MLDKVREDIKFKAWDMIDKKMRKVITLTFDYRGSNIIGIHNVYCLDNPGIVERKGHFCKLLPYTKSRDIHQKEIYVGDVVRVKYEEYNTILEYVRVVEDNTDGTGYEPLNWEDMYTEFISVEVLGNIYENPELLGIIDTGYHI